MRRARRLGAVLLALGLLSGCVSAPEPVEERDRVVEADAWTARASADAAALPERAGPYEGRTLIADGLLPPTNSWVSGAVFNGGGQPVFSGVLALLPEPRGVRMGLPLPVATPRAVFGSFVDDVHLELGSDSYLLSGLDGLAAEFRFEAAGDELGTLTSVQGWPYLEYRAASAQSVTLPPLEADGAAWTVTGSATGTEYRVVVVDGEASESGTVALQQGGSVLVHAVPPGAGESDRDALVAGASPLVSATTSYEVVDGRAVTTFQVRTRAGATVFAQRPHMDFGTEVLGAGYDTIYGRSDLAVGEEFRFSVPELDAVPALDLSGLPEDQRSELLAQVRLDIDSTEFSAPDSYAGGKQLYRAASLYSLARQLDDGDLASGFAERIRGEFELWFDPAGCSDRDAKCFVYDPVLRGVTGYAPAYGSDEFNDHHFHYGYFLFALGVMASDDPSFVEPFATMADVLAADIAGMSTTDDLPQRRSFDDYEGHSWASGTSPFADGNNQESASEAVTAWAGLALWAEASGEEALEEQASWLFSVESATASRYWLGADLPEGFTSPFFALNWGGKRDYATFFDATPSAILGIELIPMSPSTAFLPDADRTRALVDDALGAGEDDLPLIDYVVMLQATVDRSAALARARALPDSSIDGGNSRSALLAWIMTRAES